MEPNCDNHEQQVMLLRLYTAVTSCARPPRQPSVDLVITITFLETAECAVQPHARVCIDFLMAGKVIGQSISSPTIWVGIRRPMATRLTRYRGPIGAVQHVRVSCLQAPH
jgi:hypothetical protein